MAHDHSAGLTTNRIEALSDGVFAVAMTVLALTITIPTPATVAKLGLPAALREIVPQVLVYIVTFINLGVLWVGQHNQYHFIARADRWFLWINILYLLLISFMPLSTALLGQYPHHRLALMVYGSNLIAATMVLALHWHYATTSGRLAHGHLNAEVVRLTFRRILLSAAALVVALALSLVEPLVALVLFVTVPLLNILPFTLDQHLRAHEPVRT